MVHGGTLNKICFTRNISFQTDASFLNGLSIDSFLSVWPLSIGLAVVRHPVDTFHVELVCAFCTCFRMHASSHDRMSDCMCDCVHDRTHDLW